MCTDVKEPRINYFNQKVNQWKPSTIQRKRSEIFNGNISEERIYVTFWNNFPQSTTVKREQSWVRSIWEPARAHSGVVDFIVASCRLALLLTAVIDHWQFLTSMCWFHALDLALVRPTPPTGETTEGTCQSVFYIVPKLQCFNLANMFISSSNWLFETGLKRCYSSVIIIITIVYNT